MFIRVEDQSGNLTIWLNVNQIAKMEESRSSEELMGYSITTVDNKEYYSPDVKAIQALLIPLVVMEPEGDIVEELKKTGYEKKCYGGVLDMEEKLDKFLAYLEENGVEISGETAFKCDDGIVLFSPNEGGGVDIAIIRNVIELNYSLGITDADVNLFNTEVGIMQELGGSEDGE